jgi:pyruvate ferredoxin oxidoreductase gamma subunit
MPKMLEIRWHARGGQGAVTASKVLADAALESGKYVQAFPEYGSERMGAPIKAFNRISDEPIIIYSQVTDPDIVVVLDETLLTNIDVAEGLVDDGIILINTEASPAEIRRKIVNASKYRIFTIDATGISRKHLGRRMPNTPTIGALTSLIDLLGSREIAESFSRNYSQKFTKDVVESNVKAILEAAEAVSDTAEAKGEGGREEMASSWTGTEPYTRLPRAGVIVASDKHEHIYAGNSDDYNTGAWRADRPVWHEDKCIHCFRCFIFCPDSAITFDPETRKVTGHDYKHCKGCGLCAEVCPDKVRAITMTKETVE